MEDFIFIREKDFLKAREAIKKNLGKKIVFSSDDGELDRKILEKEKINFLLVNLSGRKDRMKERDSGFDSVMAKLAEKNSVVLGINLDEIISSRGKAKSEILARLRQNIKLCKKNNVKMKFISQKSEKDIYDLRALGIVLGMPTGMAKNL